MLGVGGWKIMRSHGTYRFARQFFGGGAARVRGIHFAFMSCLRKAAPLLLVDVLERRLIELGRVGNEGK